MACETALFALTQPTVTAPVPQTALPAAACRVCKRCAQTRHKLLRWVDGMAEPRLVGRLAGLAVRSCKAPSSKRRTSRCSLHVFRPSSRAKWQTPSPTRPEPIETRRNDEISIWSPGSGPDHSAGGGFAWRAPAHPAAISVLGAADVPPTPGWSLPDPGGVGRRFFARGGGRRTARLASSCKRRCAAQGAPVQSPARRPRDPVSAAVPPWRGQLDCHLRPLESGSLRAALSKFLMCCLPYP